MRDLGFVLWLSALVLGCGSTQTQAPAAAEPTPLRAEPESAAATAGGSADAATAPELLPNAHQPLPQVTTGGAPSEAQLRLAQAEGYKTVISLLPQTQPEADETRALGMSFVSIPVAGAQDLTEDNARKLADAMDGADAKPLLLHCASGNRAGALLALKAFYVDHATPEAAIALGEAAGLASLRPQVEAVMQGQSPVAK